MDSRIEMILKTVLAGGDVSSITPKSRIEELLIALGQAITDISQPSEEEIATAVNNWLTEHKSELDVIPDGSITQEKLSRAIYNDVDSLSDIVSTNTEEISKLNETMADGIVCTATGQTIQITDASEKLIRDMSVTGLNLIPFPYKTDLANSGVQKGIQYVFNDNSSLTLNGTNTSGTYAYINLITYGKRILLAKGNYSVSLCSNVVGNVNLNLAGTEENGTDTFIIGATNNNGFFTFNLSSNTEVLMYLKIPSGTVIDNWTIYPILVKGKYTADTIPAYEPYAETVDVTVCGTNLADFTCNFVIGTAGTVAVDGNAISCVIDTRVNKKLYIKTDFSNLNTGIIRTGYFVNYPKIGDVGTRTNIARECTITVPDNCNYVLLGFTKDKSTFDDIKNSTIITYGTVADYAPYVSQTVSIDVATQTGWENLHTYNGTTNILPSVTADVSVDYVADTKQFVINQITAVANAIVASASETE